MSYLITSLAGLRRLIAIAATCAAVALPTQAATLPFDAELHIQPEDNSPVVGKVPQGTPVTSLLRAELTAAGLDAPPPGWIAIRSAGPFNGFVRNRDVGENGAIRTGAEIRAQPLADAPLLLIVEEGDNAIGSEPLGDWSRAAIHTDLIVFINALPPESRSQVVAADPVATAADELVLDVPAADAKPAKTKKPKREKAAKKPQEPKPAKVDPTPVETAGAPRTFEGYLLRTRRFLGRGPKYDYQLVDDANNRIALLDLSTLSSAAQLDALENRRVAIYGPGISRADVKDLIIRVQTLRLLQ